MLLTNRSKKPYSAQCTAVLFQGGCQKYHSISSSKINLNKWYSLDIQTQSDSHFLKNAGISHHGSVHQKHLLHIAQRGLSKINVSRMILLQISNQFIKYFFKGMSYITLLRLTAGQKSLSNVLFVIAQLQRPVKKVVPYNHTKATYVKYHLA